MIELTESILSEQIKQRPENAHKGNFGRGLLIGGNQQYGGAIIMAAQACVHSGAGLTTVLTDAVNRSALHSRLPEAMIIDWQDETQLLTASAAADVILIGPGLGESSESYNLLKKTIEQQRDDQWLIIDGSAINLFAKNPLPLKVPKQVIFTPHQMEWQRLSGIAISQQTPAANQKIQEQLQAIVVLKSHRTEIYGTKILRNPLGNSGMSTGGMGDTLAGMICGFLAQFEKNEATVHAAVYLHSYIGDQLAKQNYVVLPTTISENISPWMKYFSQKRSPHIKG